MKDLRSSEIMNIYEVLMLLVPLVILSRSSLLYSILSQIFTSTFFIAFFILLFPRPHGPPQRRIRELERSHAGLVGALDAKVAALQQADRQCAELRQQQAASDAEETKLRALLRVSAGCRVWIRHGIGCGDQSHTHEEDNCDNCWLLRG